MRTSIVMLAAISLVACAAPRGFDLAPASPAALQAHHRTAPSPIQHVVIIVQENRTFNDLFNGFPGALTATQGLKHDGTWQTLTPYPLFGVNGSDVCHGRKCFLEAYDNGKMDGFDLLRLLGPAPPPLLSYTYVQQQDVVIYWELAQQFALADEMFESVGSDSFAAHQYLIAGQTGGLDDPPGHPWGCDFPGHKLSFCYTYQTLADLMDAQGVSWKYYSKGIFGTPSTYSVWEAYDAISQIRYGPYWTSANIAMPETTVLSDVANGQLPAVSWVTPSFPNSDHTSCGKGCKGSGPNWVASVVDAIGNSQYWANTAIFVTWDDWGGWYDPATPQQIDQYGLGMRVPLIVISPYAKAGYVSHVQHEFGSILHFTEEQFGLPSLGTRDAVSDDLSDCFDFTQPPLPFHPVAHGQFAPSDPYQAVDDDSGD